MNHKSRRNKILDLMVDNSVAIFFAGESVIANADQVFPFWVNSNFYYLTGIEQENTILVLSKLDGVTSECIYSIKPDPLRTRWDGAWLTFDSIMEISQIDKVLDIKTFDNYLPLICKVRDCLVAYLDLEHSRSCIYKNKSFVKVVKRHANIEIRNIFMSVAKLRSVKDSDEIAFIKQSIDYTNIALEAILADISNLTNESEVEAVFNFSLRKNKIKSTAFGTIVAGGKNATTLHYQNNNEDLNKDSLLLIDCGARYNNYAADITRTYPVSGKFNDLQKKVYSWVLEGQKRVFDNIKPGISCNELNEVLKQYYSEVLIKDGLIKDASEVSEYYMHGVSHSLGIDTHDVGLLRDQPLVVGNIITVEPGLYINQWDIGIRIEDDVLVTENGFDNLSAQIKKEITDLEK